MAQVRYPICKAALTVTVRHRSPDTTSGGMYGLEPGGCDVHYLLITVIVH